MFYFGVFYPCQLNGAFYWRSVNDECACASAPLHSRLHKYQSAYSLIEFYVLMNELIFSNEIYIKWLKQKKNKKKNRQRSMFDDLKKKGRNRYFIIYIEFWNFMHIKQIM